MKFKAIPENILERMALFMNLAPMPLVDTQMAFNAARAIMAGADTGVYDAMGKDSKSADEIAKSCNTNALATKHLLDCLVGIGYVEWRNGKYSLKKKYHKWLLKDSEANLIGKLRFQLIEWNWMNHLEDYVRTGKILDLHGSLDPKQWASYQDGMRDLSINCAQELAGKLKLPAGATQMLDIGGSHGLYSIELCKKNPGLSSTILELPGAIDQASAIAAKYGAGDKVKHKAGNALTDDLGENVYDLVMINNVVHHFTEEQNRELAKKIKCALKPGGLYAIGDFIRAHKPGEGGMVAATSGLYFSMISASGNWSEEEMRSWQTGAGLKASKTITLMSLPGWKMVVGEK